MTDLVPPDVEVLLFDVMGTVVDDTGTLRRELAAAGVGDADDAAAQWDRHLTAAMAAVNAGDRPWTSHQQLCREALTAVGVLSDSDDAAADRLAHVVEYYEPWPDSVTAIDTLRRHITVVALSNADLSALAALSARSGLGWHAVVSAQLAQRYKPDPAVYRTALELLRVDSAHAMLVAAHPWDLRAAAAHGIRTTFVARPGADAPTPDDRFTLQVDDLADLAGRLGAGH